MDLDAPKVMGILNVTSDSFYSASRTLEEASIRERISKMLNEGMDIIDIGGCSTRPGFQAPGEEEEWERVSLGCKILREISKDFPLSIDTFRSSIAKKAVLEWGADIINDISGGKDPEMFKTVSELKIGYVLTHNRDKDKEYNDITAEVITELSKKVNELHRFGVNDVIIDPGFGFAKTMEENFRLLNELEEVSWMGLPLLVGISRKSMIYKTLGMDPENSLTGTIALDTIALTKGANILRVHDVRAAKEIILLYTRLKESAK